MIRHYSDIWILLFLTRPICRPLLFLTSLFWLSPFIDSFFFIARQDLTCFFKSAAQQTAFEYSLPLLFHFNTHWYNFAKSINFAYYYFTVRICLFISLKVSNLNGNLKRMKGISNVHLIHFHTVNRHLEAKNGSRNPERVKWDPLSPQSTPKWPSVPLPLSLPYLIKIAPLPKVSFIPSLLSSTCTMTCTDTVPTAHNDGEEPRSDIEDSESIYDFVNIS